MADAIQFTPIAATVTRSVAATTAQATLNAPGRDRTLRVFNAASETVFIEPGDSTVTAVIAAKSMPIPAGAVEYLTAGPGVTHVAVIGTGSTGNIYFTEGQGE